MEEDKKPERPTSAHSSDKEAVSGHMQHEQQAKKTQGAHANILAPPQDSFEDASEITPRPEPQTERSQSRSRSLISKRESTDTTAQEPKPDSPALEAAGAPTQANDDVKPNKGEGKIEATETPTEDAPFAKSPLLTAHRISVTSDMDDVSLEEGEWTCCSATLGFANKLQKAQRTRVCFQNYHYEIRETRRPQQMACKACRVRCLRSNSPHRHLRLSFRKSLPLRPQ